MVKELLKKNKIVFELYGYIQCFKVLVTYRKIVSKYNSIQLQSTNNELLSRKGLDYVWIEKILNNEEVRVFWVGNDEHQDRSGFLQSLSKIASVEVFYNECEYGQFWDHRPKEKYKKKIQSHKLYNDIASLNQKPDILLMQTWGFRLDRGIIDKIKKDFGCKVINIGMDEKHTFWVNGNPDDGTYGLKDVIDIMLTSIPEAVHWFRKEGVPSFFFPEASDSNFFYPVDVDKIYDIGLVGGKYGIRKDIVNKLQKKGFNVKVYGNGWPSGRISPSKVNEFYNQCKIVLGVGYIGYCKHFTSLKLRDFDVPMSGAFYLTSFCEELSMCYVESKEIVMYRDIDDLIDKCFYYMENEVERNAIAYSGYLRAVNDHQYKTRFSKLIKDIKKRVE
jgi:spore maturation protein CgeB